jgi:hypothetical protein
MAINGPRVDTKTEIVNVEESPTGTISAVLKISDTAHRLVVRERGLELHAGAPQPADDGFLITDVSVPTNGQPIAMQGKTELPLDPAAVGQKNARDLKLQILDGGKSLQLTGEPGKNWRGQPQPLKLTLILTEQKREPVTQERETSTTVAVPVGRQPSTASAALPSVPGDWVEIQRRASLRLLDGDKVLWEGPVPGSAPLAIGHRSCLLTTTAAKGQVFLNLRDAAAATPAAN